MLGATCFMRIILCVQCATSVGFSTTTYHLFSGPICIDIIIISRYGSSPSKNKKSIVISNYVKAERSMQKFYIVVLDGFSQNIMVSVIMDWCPSYFRSWCY